jgi:two-component sensor histidine kinase
MSEALPFALLINELITNSYKHAFKNRDTGNIYLSLTQNDKELFLQYKDDGIGFDIEKDIKDNSLGMNLIDAFTMQLKGKKTLTSKKDLGCIFTLQFFQK